MLSKSETNNIIALLKREVIPAMGCTEPMAVALATAKATELLGAEPDLVIARLSGNIIKNAMGVGIPGSEGMIGLPAAIALAVLAGKSEYNLEVLKDVNHEHVVKAKAFIDARKFQVIQARDTSEILYVEIEARKEDKVSKVIIAKEHTNFVYLKSQEEVILDKLEELGASDEQQSHNTDLSMQKVYDFAVNTPIDQLRFLLESAKMNKSVSQLAFKGDYG
ncbi:MAG: serine dehydratase subunit alpha family protein, partial [Bacteroidales bacterium]|nr:serine dehydratase subunit alpha family protein [Bacteroidales bacterium]